MKSIKRILSSVLVFTMAVGLLAGCGGKGNKELNKLDKNTVYREERLNISFPSNFNINTVAINGKTGFFSGYSYNEQTYEQKLLVAIADLESSSVKLVDLELENGWVGNIVALSDGGFAVACQLSNVDESDPMNPVYTSSVEIRVYDASGSLKKTLDLTTDYGVDYMGNMSLLGDGLLIDCYTVKLVTDNDLNVKFKKNDENGDGLGIVYKLRDGTYVVSQWVDMGGMKFVKLDVNNLSTGDPVEAIDLTSYSVMQGIGCDFFLRNSANTEILKYNIGDPEPTPIFNFINSDLYNSYFNAFAPYDDSSFIGTYSEWEKEKYNYYVCKYTKVDPATIKDKEILSLGCMYLDGDLRKFVVDYNKASEDYRIVIKDYSSYNTADDYMAGMNKFNSDISAGQGPDIIISNNTDQVANYISKGLYADLSKYIESDEEISVDNILPNLVEATSKDGKIYQIIPNFMIQTVAAKKSVLGDKEGWTMQEMLDYAASLPAGKKLFHEMTRENFLSQELAVNTTAFVDLSKAKCNFDSDEFKKVLEYMKTLKKSEDYYNELYGDNEDINWDSYESEVYNDKAVLLSTVLYGGRNFKNLLRGQIGEEICFVGYPSEERKGSCIIANMSVGISSKCRNQKSAWDLVRQFLLDDYQMENTYYIPATVSAFEKSLEELKDKPYWTDENGNKEYYDDTIWIGGKDIPSPPLTDAEVEAFKNFVYSVNKLSGSYADIETIIYEEAAAYFEGQKSVDEVVNIIQSRASIFVSEKQ